MQRDKSTSVSALVMAYNEAETLTAVIDELDGALRDHCDDYEMVIIDDGSTDGMGKIADELVSRYSSCRVVHHPINLGMGGVYRTGFREGRKDVLYFMAADGQPMPGRYLSQFLPLLETNWIVLGRLINRRDPVLSRVLSWGEKTIFRLLFPGVPKVGGPCMFRREILDQVNLRCMRDNDRSWIVLWELFIRAKANNFPIAVCDTERRTRQSGKSKGSTWFNVLPQLRGAFRLKLSMIRSDLFRNPR